MSFIGVQSSQHPEYFQHRNIEDLYLNEVSWYAKQNPDHFAFHIGEQVGTRSDNATPPPPAIDHL